MKITFLGTGAIGYPFVFCNCENCELAKKHKGKSIRKRASILINDNLLVDLTPDTQTSMNMYNKDMGKIKYLLQTHIHTDHFDENLLTARIPYMVMKNHPILEIYSHPKCLEIMSSRVNRYEDVDLITKEGQTKLNVTTTTIEAGEIVEFGEYKVKAIETTHDTKHGSLLYVISQGNKNIFYATDTPPLTEKALQDLKKIKLDVVIMDHTFGDVEYSYKHLNESLFIEQIQKLKEINCINDNTQIYGTHISHEGISYHEIEEEKAISKGYHLAYDGMELNI